MSTKYSDLTTLISNKMGDDNFVNNRLDETVSAINNALDLVNIGEIGEKRTTDLEIGYDWQREIVDVSFINGTTAYSFSSLGITNYKFASDLRIDTDENYVFEEMEYKKFVWQNKVNGNNIDSYSVSYNTGTQNLYINFNTTDTLNFEYYSDYMVDNSGTRQARFSTNTDTNSEETLLIPDRFKDAIVYYACMELARERTRDNNSDFKYFEDKGRRVVRKLIANLGTIRKKPVKRVGVRQERNDAIRWIKTN